MSLTPKEFKRFQRFIRQQTRDSNKTELKKFACMALRIWAESNKVSVINFKSRWNLNTKRKKMLKEYRDDKEEQDFVYFIFTEDSILARFQLEF